MFILLAHFGGNAEGVRTQIDRAFFLPAALHIGYLGGVADRKRYFNEYQVPVDHWVEVPLVDWTTLDKVRYQMTWKQKNLHR